jgi:hypothetical protein
MSRLPVLRRLKRKAMPAGNRPAAGADGLYSHLRSLMASEDGVTATRFEVDGENLRGGRARSTLHGGDVRFDGATGSGTDGVHPHERRALLKDPAPQPPAGDVHVGWCAKTRRASSAPRSTLYVETAEPESRLELLHRNIREFGTVTNTVPAAGDVQGEIVAVRLPYGGERGARLSHDGAVRCGPPR